MTEIQYEFPFMDMNGMPYMFTGEIKTSDITYSIGNKPILAKWHQDVWDFHNKFGFHNGWTPTEHNLLQRVNMKQEEIDELKDAIEARDRVGVVDACIDLIYFTVGTLDLLGVDADAHWDAVQNANMKKERGTKSTRPDTNGFDAVKPEGWIPPEDRHEELLAEKGFDFVD